MTSDKYIILDRDGVINEDLWGYVTTPEQFKFIVKKSSFFRSFFTKKHKKSETF